MENLACGETVRKAGLCVLEIYGMTWVFLYLLAHDAMGRLIDKMIRSWIFIEYLASDETDE